MNFNDKLNNWAEAVNGVLEEYLICENIPQKNIYEAMRYSLLAGGKRLRPVLAMAVYEMLGKRDEEILPFACAIEMIHTYSLIHDDMPAMDNDDYRRGRLTNHKVYGDALAILAGDGLLNLAFEIMMDFSSGIGEFAKNNKILLSVCDLKDRQPVYLKAMNAIGKASGVKGMIGGQVVDLESEGAMIDGDLLKYMHRCKTGALIKAPVIAAAIMGCCGEKEIEKLVEYAECIGLAFQIKDDILDVEGSLEEMGKKTGSDATKNKSTFISLYGMDESKRMLNEISEKAVDSIGAFGERGEFLKCMVGYLVDRKN
jgi:geranylgeranyl diphosphate synthase, type II